MRPFCAAIALLCSSIAMPLSGRAEPATEPQRSTYDPAVAAAVGADERGMRQFVLVVLKSGPNRVAPGPERDEMFKGHFANLKRLSNEGKLALAGPFDGVDGWRGLFILAVADLEAARLLVATDPVVARGEMIAEYHLLYASAALMLVRDLYGKVAEKPL